MYWLLSRCVIVASYFLLRLLTEIVFFVTLLNYQQNSPRPLSWMKSNDRGQIFFCNNQTMTWVFWCQGGIYITLQMPRRILIWNPICNLMFRLKQLGRSDMSNRESISVNKQPESVLNRSTGTRMYINIELLKSITVLSIPTIPIL